MPSKNRQRSLRRSPQQAAIALAVALGGAALGASAVRPDEQSGGVVRGTVTCQGMRDCQGVVVHLEVNAGSPGEEVVVDQRALTFVPHVLTVVKGTTVVFRNSDDVGHNVFSASPAKRFNLGTYAKGVDKRLVLDKPGIVEILCNVHPEMSAFIVVTPSAHAALVAPDGRFEVTGVPEGEHVLVVWHERLKPQRRPVTVAPGAPVVADVSLSR
jgi:plastocyanin